LQRLVRALDKSDVSELELQREADGIFLALRKVKASEMNVPAGEALAVMASNGLAMPYASEMPAPKDEEVRTEHKILAPLVGTFHVWAKPRGGALVAVGDRVKEVAIVNNFSKIMMIII
jgi:acetyl-CoA carboxylase biotin carboxyl carrier protein